MSVGYQKESCKVQDEVWIKYNVDDDKGYLLLNVRSSTWAI